MMSSCGQVREEDTANQVSEGGTNRAGRAQRHHRNTSLLGSSPRPFPSFAASSCGAGSMWNSLGEKETWFSGCSSGLLISSQLCAPSKTLCFMPELRSKAPPDAASHPPLPPPQGESSLLAFYHHVHQLHSFTDLPGEWGRGMPHMSHHMGQYRVDSHAGRGGTAPLPAPQEARGATSISFYPGLDCSKLSQAWPLQGLETPLYFCLLAPESGALLPRVG